MHGPLGGLCVRVCWPARCHLVIVKCHPPSCLAHSADSTRLCAPSPAAALPILICFAAFIAFHPGWYLPSKEERRQMELQAQGADLESAKVSSCQGQAMGCF